MKTFLLLASLVVSQVLGDIWLSRGMKEFGEANPLTVSGLLALIGYLFTSPWIWLGVLVLIFSLFMYFIAVSHFDLSYVLPIHASSYVLNAFFAWMILGENVSLIRWISALTISLGVLIVSLSENPLTEKTLTAVLAHTKRKWLNRSLFFLFPLTFSLPKTLVAIIVTVLADAGGDLFNARGMKQIGSVELGSYKDILQFIRRVLTNSYILRGIACQTVAFISFISVLSWADISLVRPATAATYIFTLLGARLILHEHIKLGRLIGIVIVGCGVALISFG